MSPSQAQSHSVRCLFPGSSSLSISINQKDRCRCFLLRSSSSSISIGEMDLFRFLSRSICCWFGLALGFSLSAGLMRTMNSFRSQTRFIQGVESAHSGFSTNHRLASVAANPQMVAQARIDQYMSKMFLHRQRLFKWHLCSSHLSRCEIDGNAMK